VWVRFLKNSVCRVKSFPNSRRISAILSSCLGMSHLAMSATENVIAPRNAKIGGSTDEKSRRKAALPLCVRSLGTVNMQAYRNHRAIT
jgi:hypothetical protein